MLTMFWWWTTLWIALASTLTLGLFAVDKARARVGHRRIRERTLHLLELLGGWPGAWIAFAVVRHKNRKLPFVAVTLLISAVHVALLVAAARSL